MRKSTEKLIFAITFNAITFNAWANAAFAGGIGVCQPLLKDDAIHSDESRARYLECVTSRGIDEDFADTCAMFVVHSLPSYRTRETEAGRKLLSELGAVCGASKDCGSTRDELKGVHIDASELVCKE
jgi:hypothetical protein